MAEWVQMLLRFGLHHGLTALTRIWRLAPASRRLFSRVACERDVAYGPIGKRGAHRLDLWRPKKGHGPWPLVVYIHGGGFGLLSKETHWPMAATLAEAGYCVANINYRLAPPHPYPAALEDVLLAIRFVCAQSTRLGIDASRFALMGDSAGANLAVAASLALRGAPLGGVAQRSLPEAHRLCAVVAGSGFLDVETDCVRRLDKGANKPMVSARIATLGARYLQASAKEARRDGLSSPVRWLESERPSPPDLPSYFVVVGERDVVGQDSVRLHEALIRRGLSSELTVYPEAGHVFFAFLWRADAKAMWRDTCAFLRRTLSAPG